MKFKSNIEVQAGIEDSSGSAGTAGQILSSLGPVASVDGVDWIDPANIVTSATDVIIECKNTSGVTIAKGTPVYQTGNVGATAVIEVAVADASDEDKMAAIGLLQSDLINNAFGYVVVTGGLLNITTSPIDGVTPTTGDTIYVKPGGGLTLTKPTGVNFIQNVGLVGKVSGGNAGSITVSSIMRSNDVPTPLYIDHDNQRLGIGTTAPSAKLDISTTGTGDSMIIRNDDASSSAAPVFVLKRDSSSPANGDYLGQLKFKGENDASQEIVYAKITAKISDVTDGTEDSLIETAVKSGGSNLIVSRQTGTDLKLINGVGLEVDGDATFAGTVTAPTFLGDLNGTINTATTGVTQTAGNNSTLIATTAYADAAAAAVDPSGVYLPLAGGTMTGDVIFPGEEANSFKIAFTGASASSGLSTIDQSGAGLYIGANSRVNNQGSVVFDDTLLPSSGIYFDGWDGDDMKFYTGSSGNPINRLTIQADGDAIFTGNVGIGTTSPSAKLDIYGDSNSSDNMVELINSKYDSTNTTGETGILFGWNNHVAARITAFKEGTTNRTGFKIIGEAGYNTPTTIATFRSTGKVGIGTTNPSSKLHVLGGSGDDIIARFKTTGTGTSDYSEVHILNDNDDSLVLGSIGSNYTNSAWAGMRYVYSTVGDLGLKATASDGNVRIYAGGAGDERMRITSSGNVGIGTTTPQADFVVSHQDTSGIEIEANFQMGVNNILSFDRTAGALAYETMRLAAGDFWFVVLGVERMRIDSSGYVEIKNNAGNANASLTLANSDLSIGINQAIGYLNFKSNDLSGGTSAGGVGGVGVYSETEYNTGNTPSYMSFYTHSNTNNTGTILGSVTERMRIDSSGNVGIGTTSPAQPFQVDAGSNIASFRSVGTGENNKELLIQTGGDRVILDAKNADDGTATSLAFELGNSEKARLTTTGLGIGTTSPSSELTIGADTPQIDLLKTSSADVLANIRAETDAGSGGKLVFQTKRNGNTALDRMTIDDDGNVGIGTDSPDKPLHIQTNSSAYGSMRIQRDSTTQGETSIGFFGKSDTPNNEAWVIGENGWGHTGKFVIGNENGGAGGNVRMLIQRDGNVGIGTTSPDTKLHVEGNLLVDAYSQGEDNGIFLREGFLTIDQPSITVWDMSNSGASPDGLSINAYDGIRFRENGGEVARFKDGNFGIGTTSPSEKLDVSGTFGVSDLPFNTDSVSVLVADEITGVEEVTNGSFATDADWNKNSNWTISGGTANADGTSNSDMNQIPVNGNPVVGEVFRVSFEVTARTQGQVRIIYGGASTAFVTVVGKYEYIITATTTDRIRIQCNSSFIGSVDNLSIKQITSASNQIQKRELGAGAFGPTPVGAYLPLSAGASYPLTGDLYQTMGAIGVAQADQDYIAKIYELDSDGFLSLYTGQSTPLEKVRISSYGDSFFVPANNGNVGIGTTSPGQKLDVSGNIASNSIYLYDSTSNDRLVLDLDGSDNLQISTGTSTGSRGITFLTENSEKMRILSGGNVGIGTTSPDTLLDVSSASSGTTAPAIRITNTLSTGDWSGVTSDLGRFEFFTDDTSGNAPYTLGYIGIKNDYTIGTPTLPSGAMVFATATYNASGGAVERMRINSDGNVGIGTTSPDALLDMEAATNPTIRLTNSTNPLGAADVGTLEFFTKDASTGASRVLSSIVCLNEADSPSVPDGQLVFKTSLGGANANPATEKMRIDANGNVGIGTTSPNSNGGASARVLHIHGSSSGDWAVTHYTNSDTGLAADDGTVVGVIGSSKDMYMFNYEDSNIILATNSSERMRIDSSGNVMMGKTSQSGNAALTVKSTAGGNTGIILVEGDTTNDGWGVYATTANKYIITRFTDGSYSDKFTILEGGNVGIGTTSPSQKLSVSDGMHVTIASATAADTSGDYTVSIGANSGSKSLITEGDATFAGTATATNFILSSDERLKENIEEVCDNRVKADWKTFELKTEKGQKRYGVIAQELEKTNPEFVREDNQGFKSVAYIDLLIAKIAELEARLEKLER